MAEETDKKEDEEKIIPVGDGVADLAEEQEKKDPPKKEETSHEEDDEDDEEEDSSSEQRLGHGEREESDDEKRERRRAERKERKRVAREIEERRKKEIKFLRTRNEQVERQLSTLAARLGAVETSSVEGRIAQIKGAIKNADAVIARGIEEANGEAVAEANSIRDNLRDQLGKLENVRSAQQAHKETQERAESTRKEPDEGELDPQVMEQLRRWHGRNNWFKFDRSDQDSAIVGAIEDRLYQEGSYDPTTPEYYRELDRRVKQVLPHRFERQRANGEDRDDDRDDREDRRVTDKKPSGPKFRVGGRERSLRSNEVHVSAERRKAMEEAGVWDDPQLRERYLKRYKEWDREHGFA